MALIAQCASASKSQNNPNLIMLLNYNLSSGVSNLFVVPKQFFVKDVIERRKPLAGS